LPLTNSKASDGLVRLQRHAKLMTQVVKAAAQSAGVVPKATLKPQSEIVQHRERRDIQWILMQHPDPQADGLRRRAQPHRKAIQPYLSCIGLQIAR